MMLGQVMHERVAKFIAIVCQLLLKDVYFCILFTNVTS